MSMSCDSGISEFHTDPLEQRWEWSVITKQVQRRRTPTPGTAAERSFKTGVLFSANCTAGVPSRHRSKLNEKVCTIHGWGMHGSW